MAPAARVETTVELTDFLGRPAVRWSVGASTFEAVPGAGARLVRWDWQRSGAARQPLIFWPPESPPADFAFTRGGNPILFPFCARTFVGGTIHLWRDPAGVVRPMPLHGIARQAEFRVIELTDDGFTSQLVADAAAREAYPFEYRFEVRYVFHATGFRVELSLANLGATPIPWSAGHHFYVVVPWRAGLTRADYSVSIPTTQSWRQDGAGLLDPVATTGRVALTSETLNATMHGALAADEMEVRERASGVRVRIAMPGAIRDFPDAVFTTWTQGDAAPYYCFEPWMGPANAPSLGRGVHFVPPGGRQVFPVEVLFEVSAN